MNSSEDMSNMAASVYINVRGVGRHSIQSLFHTCCILFSSILLMSIHLTLRNCYNKGSIYLKRSFFHKWKAVANSVSLSTFIQSACWNHLNNLKRLFEKFKIDPKPQPLFMQLQFYPTVVSCNKLSYLGEDRLPHYTVKLLRAFRVKMIGNC